LEASRGLRAPPGKVLNTRVDGPIQDRVIAPVSPPPIVISPFGWLAPKVNLEARVGGFKPSEGPTLPPHPNAAIPPAPGKVVVFDAAGLAALANPGPVKAGPVAPRPAAPPEAPAG